MKSCSLFLICALLSLILFGVTSGRESRKQFQPAPVHSTPAQSFHYEESTRRLPSRHVTAYARASVVRVEAATPTRPTNWRGTHIGKPLGRYREKPNPLLRV